MQYKIKNIIDALFENEINVFVQGCNCFCGFGRGLAEEVLDRIPDAYYKADLKTNAGDKSKLGTYSHIQLSEKQYVVNAYTQYHWIKRKNNEPKVKKGRGYVLADYVAIRNVLKQIASDFQGLKIGLPKIGAGWANGDWDTIESIIQEELVDKGLDVTIYVISENDIPKKDA